jgi:two-component system phosphate regulon sensor histidine kinase PhoR
MASPTERALVDALDEPALVVEGSIVRLANPPAQRLFGSGIEGRDVRLAIRHPQALEQILAHRSAKIDVTGIAELGRSWRLVIRPVGRDSALVRMVDRSDSVSAEKMRVDFVANASHELRTPLAALSGFIDTLRGSARDDAAARERFLAIMKSQATRMARLIDDLLSLSRIELTEHMHPDKPVDLVPIVRQVTDGLQTLAVDRNVEIQLSAPDAPMIVLGDRDELTRVFENLVENALKYGASGKRVSVSFASAESAAGTEALVAVRDYGPGIAAEHLPRLTERFYRVDVTQSRAEGGTGLGLSLVKHILNRHRGRIVIESAAGKGATFTARLPLVPSEAG